MIEQLTSSRPIEILLVEDNAADVRLTQEALGEARILNHLHVVSDGVEALRLLRGEGRYAGAPKIDIVLLDLNLPSMDGRQVLTAIKADEALKCTPVVVLTTSQREADILSSYKLSANCYITKPVDFEKFLSVVKSIKEFWLSVVTLPNAQ